MVSNAQLAIFAVIIFAYICVVIWKFRRDEKKPPDHEEVCRLLSEKGPLLLSEIMVKTRLSEERVKVVLTELTAKGVVYQRPVPGCEHVSEATTTWGMDLRRQRAG